MKLTFFEAAKFCSAQGMDLALFENERFTDSFQKLVFLRSKAGMSMSIINNT
jgi:hypothetical protein